MFEQDGIRQDEQGNGDTIEARVHAMVREHKSCPRTLQSCQALLDSKLLYAIVSTRRATNNLNFH